MNVKLFYCEYLFSIFSVSVTTITPQLGVMVYPDRRQVSDCVITQVTVRGSRRHQVGDLIEDS